MIFSPKSSFPAQKRVTYEKLFDNYILIASRPDALDNPGNLAELEALLYAVINSAPMRLARAFIDSAYKVQHSNAQWRELVYIACFACPKRVRRSRVKDLSICFYVRWISRDSSHLELGGIHVWYFYDHHEDYLCYGAASYSSGDTSFGLMVPEVVTMHFYWKLVTDNRTKALNKPMESFFVGPSAELMIALTMVRIYDGQGDSADIVLDGMRLGLRLCHEDRQSYPTIAQPKAINTFYPVLKTVLGSNVVLQPPPLPP